ncbi:polyprenol phosphomannose-dependent alpha 1,6 mannosyltransferase MptB [Amycolatopsis anabasis]|uniref:polyprenol phosphomannose-dependent alpha 1,6 mannosyltransferase MptB n=1 Tax=Amycolatopsis anabasis TaxID=1840409 RepID=UPI001FE9217B|nr:polyprenol phosphomannose-dependent alpha 1,6 mannosyltransferase MptB [Amycolatopsis anabasis]
MTAVRWVGTGGAAVLTVAASGIPGPTAVVLALGLTGMTLVVLAWLHIGRWVAEVSVRRLYWIGVSWCAPLLLARPLFSGDVFSYLAQGVIAAKGLDPYLLGSAEALGADSPVTERVGHLWRDTPAPYGPAFVALSRVIAQVAGDDVVLTVVAHRLVELAGVALMAWALPRLARRAGVAPSTAVWLGLLNPLVLWHVVAGVHNEGIMLGLVLAGMEITLGAARPGRAVAGLAVLIVAANVKVVAVAAVFFAGAGLIRRWGSTTGRRVALGFGLLAGVVAGSLAISAVTGLGTGWLGAVGASGHVHSWLAPTNQLGFLIGGIGALGGLSLTSAAIGVVVAVGAVIGAVVAAVLWWRTFRGRPHPLYGLGSAFAAVLVTGPVVQPWYLLWTVLPLAASARTSSARWVLAGVSAVFALVLPPTGGGPGVLIQGYLVVLVLFGGAVALERRRVRTAEPLEALSRG